MIEHETEIVLVEDSDADAELITRVLRKHRLANTITRLRDGDEALSFLLPGKRDASQRMPKLVMLDIQLPKVDGIEVLRRIKGDPCTRDIPVVILTSSYEERDVLAAYSLGVNSYVTKPIQFAEFAKAVADLGMYWLVLNVSPKGNG